MEVFAERAYAISLKQCFCAGRRYIMEYREMLLTKLFAAGDFQPLQDKLAFALQVAIITVDFNGSPVSKHSGCSEFCRCVREHAVYGEFCKRCDSRGGLDANRQQKPSIYVCHMGLVDFAIPITVNDSYVGAVMAGQIKVDDNPELERVTDKKNEAALGGDLKILYSLLPKMSYERVKALADMLFSLYNYVTLEAAKKISDMKSAVEAINENAPPLLLPAVNYISENHNKRIKLETLSALCGISPSYFSKTFKKAFGEGLSEFINRLRVERAKELLIKTRKTVGDIAYETGFDECGYFIKIFKRLTDFTPGAYRENFFILRPSSAASN